MAKQTNEPTTRRRRTEEEKLAELQAQSERIKRKMAAEKAIARFELARKALREDRFGAAHRLTTEAIGLIGEAVREDEVE